MHMQDNPRAQAPKKERPFLPRLKDGGILARRGEGVAMSFLDVALKPFKRTP
jgi:hypothetical protein